MRMPNIFKIAFLVIDLFCGAGGVSTGFVNAKGVALVIACVNHDHTAILSHKCNHPNTHHFEEDIRTLNIEPLKELLRQYKKLYPWAKSVLWGSLECQSHSKARGGMAKNADSRTLDDVFYERYVKELGTDYVMVENVVEFELHGPTRIKVKGKTVNEYNEQVWELVMIKDKHGKWMYGHEIIPERKGEYFKEFNDNICAQGYEMEWAKMNAADYGAFTSRERLFGIFKRPGLPNAWPKKTHHKQGGNGLPKWNAVRSKIDFTDEGYSIFHRNINTEIPKRHRKDIGDNSMARYYEGCIKHIAGGWEAFELHVRTYFPDMVERHCSKRRGKGRKEQPAKEKAFIAKFYSGDPETRNLSINEALGTIPTENRFALLQASFLGTYHGNGDNTHSMFGAAPTLPCGDNVYMINANFIDKNYNGTHNHSSIDAPLGAMTQVNKESLITAKVAKQGAFDFAMIDSTQYTNVPQSVDEAMRTITADRHWPYILNPSYGGHTHSIDNPCATIVASQHKAPLCIVFTEQGVGIRIFDTDSEAVIMLKQFMAMYGIIDIKMRMLKVNELMRIQGFPENYILAGSQEEQKKHIGNSVEPNQVTCWALAIYDELEKLAA